jgi:ABC-type nitrate/sulfonate/bicarbonate transport system substrate-binding protein
LRLGAPPLGLGSGPGAEGSRLQEGGPVPESRVVTVGQFSESPVLLAAGHLGLLADAGLALRTERVASSPAQFGSLARGDLDLVITSPDNVLLYGTTAANPLGERLELRLVRAIDRGLGLALVTRPEVATVADLRASVLGVDVTRSGFALLLYRMLDHLGVDRADVDLRELGSTPRRAEALLAAEVGGTILNAESRVRALRAGMTAWVSSADLYPDYLGTVLAAPAGTDRDLLDRILSVWGRATAWLAEAPAAEVCEVLARHSDDLGSPEYLELLRTPAFGLVARPVVALDDLRVLTSIRRASGAYSPDDDALAALVAP